MTIQEWNLFLNATMLVLMAAYAFWLNHITKQQDKLKTNTLESLNAVIASMDAEIGRLRGEIAPELAKAYKTMKDHAEEMTKRAGLLEEELAEQKAAIGEKEGLLSVNYLMGKVDGLLVAAERGIELQESMKAKAESREAFDVLRGLNNLTGAVLGMAQETNNRAREQERPAKH